MRRNIMISTITGKLKGKKTYIIIGISIILGIIEGFDIYEIPATGWIVLTAMGFGFMRSAVNTIEKLVEEMRKKK